MRNYRFAGIFLSYNQLFLKLWDIKSCFFTSGQTNFSVQRKERRVLFFFKLWLVVFQSLYIIREIYSGNKCSSMQLSTLAVI